MDTSSNNFQEVFKNILAKDPCDCKQIRPDQIPASENVLKHLQSPTMFPGEMNYFEKVNQNEITLKRDVQTSFIFNISEASEISERTRVFVFQRHITISTSKLHQFSNHRICIETMSVFRPSKLRRKSCKRKNIGFSPIKITSYNVC